MRRTTWLGWAAAAAMATGAGAALAAKGPGVDQGGPEDGPRMSMMDGGPGMAGIPGPRMFERLAGELQLTADQQQKIRGVFESARPEMEQVREQRRQNAAKLRATTPGAANYDAVVSDVARNAGDLATRSVTNGAQLRAQIWAILSPEQRQKLDTLQAQRQDRQKARMEKRRQMRAERP